METQPRVNIFSSLIKICIDQTVGSSIYEYSATKPKPFIMEIFYIHIYLQGIWYVKTKHAET